MPRKRSYIPLPQKLAATLACLLPSHVRNDLRGRKVPAETVISLFEFHHVQYHAFDNADEWHNLHPLAKEQHAERTPGDIATVAKVKRLEKRWTDFVARMMRPDKGKDEPRTGRPKRKIPSRPFPKRERARRA